MHTFIVAVSIDRQPFHSYVRFTSPPSGKLPARGPPIRPSFVSAAARLPTAGGIWCPSTTLTTNRLESDISVQTAAALYAQETLSAAERLLAASGLSLPSSQPYLPLFSPPPLTPNTPGPGPLRALTLILITSSNTCALKLTQALTHPAKIPYPY